MRPAFSVHESRLHGQSHEGNLVIDYPSHDNGNLLLTQ